MSHQAEQTRIPLTQLPRILQADYGVRARYFTCWRCITDGQIPATKIGSRWFVRSEKMPEIAATLRQLELTA